MARYGSYLFRRKGSPNWWLRLQYPPDVATRMGTKKVERSLGTSDRAEAELRAAEDIFTHKAMLFARTHREALAVGSRRFRYDVGKVHTLPDGRHAVATKEGVLIAIDEEGQRVEIPNPTVVDVAFRNVPRHEAAFVRSRRRTQTNDAEALLSRWIERKGVGAHVAAEAKGVLTILVRISGVDDFCKFTRDHLDKLSNHLVGIGNKSPTINKKIGHLRAAANLAIDDSKLSTNIFSRYSISRNDSIRREPLSEDDMKKVRNNLSRLSAEDQKLWKLLACTGMRLSEPFEPSGLLSEGSVRYVIIGKKTDTSLRRVPIPSRLDALFPEGLTGPLIGGRPDPAGKRLAYFLRSLGISYDRTTGLGSRSKVVHSLRHRMKDRLRELRCPLDVQYEILGHEERTIAAGYGRGSPVADLKHWLDQVDF